MPSITGRTARWIPSRADLDGATAHTAAVMASDASPYAREAAAALEEAVTNAYLRRPGADAELQQEAEAEFEACA
jgi:hypothetical protein